MFRNIWLKTLYDRRWFLLGWGIGAAALFALTTVFYPSIKDTMNDIFRSIPPAMHGLLGEVSNYQTLPGYLGSAVYGLRAEMLVVPMAIILALTLSATEERTGKLYQLLAQPVSRVRVALQRWVAAVIIIAGIVLISHFAVWMTVVMIGETVPYDVLNKISAMLALFTIALFTITYSIGIATGSRALTMLVPTVWVMVSLIIEAFGSMVDWLGKASNYSLLTYFKSARLVDNPIDIWHVVILLSLIAIPLTIGVLMFRVRDIKEG